MMDLREFANCAARLTLEQGGATIGLDGHRPSSGYAVGGEHSSEWIVPRSSFTPDTIRRFMLCNVEALLRPGSHLGTWEADGNIYLDVSTVEPDRKKAADLARDRRQLAFWDLAQGQEAKA